MTDRELSEAMGERLLHLIKILGTQQSTIELLHLHTKLHCRTLDGLRKRIDSLTATVDELMLGKDSK